jgi:hypothetical protein
VGASICGIQPPILDARLRHRLPRLERARDGGGEEADDDRQGDRHAQARSKKVTIKLNSTGKKLLKKIKP